MKTKLILIIAGVFLFAIFSFGQKIKKPKGAKKQILTYTPERPLEGKIRGEWYVVWNNVLF